MEHFTQYVKDRTEGFNDYFPCSTEHCRFEHVKAWLNFHQLNFNLFKRREAFKQPPDTSTQPNHEDPKILLKLAAPGTQREKT
jgi:hypothetical protein